MAEKMKRQRKLARKEQRERLARHIAGRITGTQGMIAGKLNGFIAKMGRRQQILFFALVIAAMAAYCLYLVLDGLG